MTTSTPLRGKRLPVYGTLPTMSDIESLLADQSLTDQAFAWVTLAMSRQEATTPGTATMLPTLAPGIFVTELNICQDYSCGCGWNATINGRVEEKKERILALAQRPADDHYGEYRVLGKRDTGKLWSISIAGNEDMGLDALIAVLL